ncbi:MAG: hypothetical protein JXA92_09720, partial [candidate division Zixibacteria bacterium]|nr:hypothetical protein [candidate division Zixibacteria bacterium]
MMDRLYILLILALFLLPKIATAQDKDLPDSLTGAKYLSFEQYRPVGETRQWTFVTRDTTIGRLVSVVKEDIKINGRRGYVIDEKLTLKYDRPENPMALDIEGDHYISDEGYYLGDKLKISVNENVEKFEFELEKGVLKGYFTRSGKKVEKTEPFATDLFAWENYFIDQLELFLAMRDINVGDTLRDTIYLPQSMYKSAITGTVDKFLYKEIYRNKFDSVFQIHLTQPQEFILFLTPDKRLVRIDFPQSRIRGYLDLVQKKPQTSTLRPKYTLMTFLSTLPAYLFYLLVTLLSLMFLVRKGFKWKRAYPALLIGVAVYFLMLLTQFPLQKYIIAKWLFPAVSTGGSFYSWGLSPALATGLVQEIIKLAVIIIIIFWFNPRLERFIIIGAFCGAGFGFMEACYLASPTGIL